MTNLTDATSLSLFDRLMNSSEKKILSARSWPFLEKEWVYTTTSNYTTGTILSIANGATTVTGTSTVWTASMAGSIITITGGDSIPYRILSVTNGTTLELERNYLGTTISAGTAAYTISDQFVAVPADMEKILNVSVKVSSINYVLKEAPSEDYWIYLNTVSYTSNIPRYYFYLNGAMGIWPLNNNSTNVVRATYRALSKDLSVADYTTGTIVSIANGATTVTGSATTWTNKMVGRFLKITDSDVAGTGAGDGFWYEINSRTSNTVLELKRPYMGTGISAGSATYIIGQMGLLPEGYSELPVYDALRYYYGSIQPDQARQVQYDKMYTELYAQLVHDRSSKTSNYVIDEGTRMKLINPNLTIIN